MDECDERLKYGEMGRWGDSDCRLTGIPNSSKTSQNLSTLPFISSLLLSQKPFLSASSNPTAQASWSGLTLLKHILVWAAETYLIRFSGPSLHASL